MNNIGWCDITINPVVGCTKCSPGCEHCYAERFAAQLARNPKTAKKYAGVVDENGKWAGKISEPDWSCFDRLPKSPRRVFVGSMTDLFHPQIPFHRLDQIFLTFLRYPQHTFLVLTKRPERATEYFPRGREWITDTNLITGKVTRYPFPIPNLWLGVTICNQEEADAKLAALLEIPAKKRFVSIEPMLGPMDLTRFLVGLDWVICGGESGPDARPIHPDWVHLLRSSCMVAGVPFYFKGWGGTKKAQALLDGRKWREFPA